MKKGTFIGVGVGPGDPELMTLKGIKAIMDAKILMLPSKDRESCRAFDVAMKAVSIYTESSGKAFDHDGREYLYEPFPMKMDREELKSFHERAAQRVRAILDKGQDVVFPVIGDPSVYSTYDHVAVILEEMGYKTDRIGGVASFLAAADRLGVSLADTSDSIHIIPGSADLNEALGLSGTRVFMKTGKKLRELKKELIKLEKEGKIRVCAVTECGLPGESVAFSTEEIKDDWGYMTIIIVTKGTEGLDGNT